MNGAQTLDAWLKVQAIRKRFGARPLFDKVSFEVARGQTLAVIGASGSGKTTLLRILAGLDRDHQGRIFIDDRDVTSLPARQRQALYLYQEPLLFPHLNVFENIAFGLRLRRLPKTQVREQVEQVLGEIELQGLDARKPESLSGGQRQRVAFGRALVVQPALLLLDEPFGSLDPETRAAMQELFGRVASQHRITSVFVTHDLKEALRVGDQFGLIADGRLRNYIDRAAFCADPDSGVQRELRFWEALRVEAIGSGAKPTP
ncbi:MAG: ABC transporter ATP-binding protein [Gammaproteobacteria bacterium]|nr:ABC transporter ATP-binding protein [Gammaproteobacteria bacterium]